MRRGIGGDEAQRGGRLPEYGEREQGTLRQVLSVGVPRHTLVAGKALGAAAGLALVTVMPWAGVAAPMLPMRTVSLALAATGFAHHRHFVDAAESYRRRIQQVMNDDIVYNSRPGVAYTAGPELSVAPGSGFHVRPSRGGMGAATCAESPAAAGLVCGGGLLRVAVHAAGVGRLTCWERSFDTSGD